VSTAALAILALPAVVAQFFGPIPAVRPGAAARSG
jgi:hypothetical protein